MPRKSFWQNALLFPLALMPGCWHNSPGTVQLTHGSTILRPRDDVASLQRQIHSHFSQHGLVAIIRVLEPDADQVLMLPFRLPNQPEFTILVVIQPSARDSNGTVSERVVTLRLFGRAWVPPENRVEALEAICQRNRCRWAGAFVLDSDGEILCDWSLNITKAGLPVENVLDAVARMVLNWTEFYPRVRLLLISEPPDPASPGRLPGPFRRPVGDLWCAEPVHPTPEPQYRRTAAVRWPNRTVPAPARRWRSEASRHTRANPRDRVGPAGLSADSDLRYALETVPWCRGHAMLSGVTH